MKSSLEFLHLIASGALLTIELTVLGSLLAAVVAFTIGFARLATSRWFSTPARIFMEFFRGTSIFVQLFWAYFVLPLLGFSLTPFQAGVLVLGLNTGAYASEVVRGAMLAIPREQFEACIALNLRPWQRLRYVLVPQAFKLMVPSFGNNIVELLKATSVVSLISLSDMTFRAQAVRTQTGDAAMPFLTILVIYFAMAIAISAVMRHLERRLGRSSAART